MIFFINCVKSQANELVRFIDNVNLVNYKYSLKIESN